MTSNGRVARLTALALATGTLVATGVGSAAAATTSSDSYTAGNTTSVFGNQGIISLELNLPAGIPGVLPQHVVQDLVVTKSNTRSGANPDAVSSALLAAGGNVDLLNTLLGKDFGTTATLANPDGADTGPKPVLANVLGVAGLLETKAMVRNPNADGVVSKSTSSVADLHIDGAGVLDAVLAPVLDQINAVLGTLDFAPVSADAAPTAALTPTVTNIVNVLAGTLEQATSGASAPVSQPVQDAVKQATALLDGLLAQLDLKADTLGALGVDDTLLGVDLIQSQQTVTRSAGTVTSTVDNKLVGVNVLGGLVKVDGLVSQAQAALDKNGNPVATPPVTGGKLVVANVADLLTAQVTDKLEVLLGGALGDALPADVLTQVNGLISNLTALTNDILGVSFTGSDASANKTTAEHNKSEQVVSPSVLTVDPLHNAAAPLLRIKFVPAAASVVRAESVAPATPVTVEPPATVTSLPRTGANLPLTGTAAAALIALALVARRRRQAETV